MEGKPDHAGHGAPLSSRLDARTRFRLRASVLVEGGLIRHTNRLRLYDEARAMGLSAFEASLVIAEVQYGSTSDSADDTPRTPSRRQTWRHAALLWSAMLFLLAAILIMLRLRG